MSFDDIERDEPEQLLLPGRRNFLKTLGVAGIGGLAGCGGDTSQETTTQTTTTQSDETTTTTTEEPSRTIGGSYVSGSGTDAQSLNFLSIADGESSDRIGLTLDGAYAITTDLEVFPLWADISTEDGKTYTVELRDNLQWGAGYGQMTADDWVYMIKEVFQADPNWAGYPNPGDWKRDGKPIPVEKTGKLTFDIKLPSVDPAFPLKPIMWGAYCMPKGIIEKYRPDEDVDGLKQDQEIQTLAYSGNLGPYNYENWARESEFVATRNDDYYMHDVDDVPEAWTRAPYFEDFTYKVIPEESTRLNALKAGELTATGIPETKVKQFEDLDDISINVAPQPYMTSLIYNQRANGNFYEVLRKKEARQALARAVNKNAIVDQILRGYATVGHTFQPTFSKWYSDESVVQTGVGDEYGAEKARQMLEPTLSGTPYSYDGDRIVDENGEQVTLQLVYSQGTDTTKTMSQFIAQEYDKIGLNVELSAVQFNTMLSKYAQNSVKNNPDYNGEPDWNRGPFNAGPRDQSVSQEPWDLMTGIIFNTYPRTPSSTRTFAIEKGGINYYGYVPETDFNALYDDAETTVDEAARKDIYADIFGALSKEQPFNFLNMGVSIAGYDARVQGPSEEFGYGWDSNTWYFKQG